MSSKKRILVLVGPSGSGKTTVGEELTRRGIHKLVTTTTREPRPKEVNGRDYYFLRPGQLNSNAFIEQTSYNGNTYGLTRQEVEKALKEQAAMHVSLDHNGARAMKEVFPEETRIIFFEISEKEMVERMRNRGDSEEKMAERLAFSREIQENIPPPDTDLIVRNINVENTVQAILDAFELKYVNGSG